MFSNISNASKICLIYLIANLKIKNFSLLDTQFINPHLKNLGAVEVTRKKYLEILEDSLSKKANFNKKINHSSIYETIHSMTQTS